jgi:hypothetical protein
VAKYGLTKTRPVAAIVGASAITDGVSLVVLALIVGAETGDASGARLVLDIAIGFVVLGVYCFVVVPAVARWFFTGLGQERTLRYMLVFIGLTSSAVVAELVGVEPLIGAFFVGVGLNRFVPNASPLMAVTDFFGNAFFIPTFLVSVGLLFDPEVMFEWSTIRLALGFVAALVVGKAIAAWLTGRIFGLGTAEVGCCSRCRSRRRPPRWQPPSSASRSAVRQRRGQRRHGGRRGEPDRDLDRHQPVRPRDPPARRRATPGRRDDPRPGPRRARRTPRRAAARAGPRRPGRRDRPAVGAGHLDERRRPLAGRAKRAEVDRVLRELGGDAETVLRVDRSVSTGLHQAAIEIDASLLLLGWPGPTTCGPAWWAPPTARSSRPPRSPSRSPRCTRHRTGAGGPVRGRP